LNTPSLRKPAVAAPRTLFVFLAAALPHFSQDSIPGRARARAGRFVASTPGTALIMLSGVLTVLITLLSVILSVARGTESFMLLLGLIYALLIVATGIVVAFLFFAMTVTHLILGDRFLRRMQVAARASEPDVEWLRL